MTFICRRHTSSLTAASHAVRHSPFIAKSMASNSPTCISRFPLNFALDEFSWLRNFNGGYHSPREPYLIKRERNGQAELLSQWPHFTLEHFSYLSLSRLSRYKPLAAFSFGAACVVLFSCRVSHRKIIEWIEVTGSLLLLRVTAKQSFWVDSYLTLNTS